MIKKYRLLLKIQLYNLFGINKLLHSHDKKERNHFWAIGSTGIIIVGLLIYFSGYISINLAKAGLIQVLPTLLVVSYSMIVLFLTFLKSSGTLIGLKDYDMVMSLPVKSIAIILSRLTVLFFTNLIIGIIVLVPAIIIYGIYQQPEFGCYFMLLTSLLFIPVIPMVIGLAAGILIIACSSRFKHNNIFSLVFNVVGILLLIFITSRMQNIDLSKITDISNMITDYINQFYPPAYLFSRALLYSDWHSFGIFIALSVGLGVVFVIIISHFYKNLNTAIFSHHTDKKFQLKEMNISSPFIALYKKELRRFFSCTIYVLNSSIVMILFLLFSIISVFYMPNMLVQQLESIGIIEVFQNGIPLAIAVLVSINCTTSSSLSLEGKNRWIMCSVPVKTDVIYKSKIAVNLTVILPALWIGIILLRIIFPLSFVQTALLFITPTVYAFFISVLGMLLNVKFPKYDWVSEYYAVKGGSFSVLATVIITMLCSIAPLYLCMLFSEYAQIIVVIITVIIGSETLTMYHSLIKIKLYI